MWYEAYTGDLPKLNNQQAAVAPVVKSAIPANGNGAEVGFKGDCGTYVCI